MQAKLTVFFEDPYWIGVFEREDISGYQVSRVVFGSEPTDAELYEFIKSEYRNLKFGKPIAGQVKIERKKNFKRMQREVRKQVMEQGVGTKAQQAMKQALAETKQERRQDSRKRNREEERLQFELRQQKKKEKHKGH